MAKRKHSAWHYVTKIVGEIVEHPANRDHRARALARSIGWQIRKRLRQGPLDIDFEGLRLRCYPDSGSASNVAYFTSRYDFDEMAFLEHYLRPGDGFLDIGANIGTYSLFVAAIVGSGGQIEAWEPLPKAAARLRENVAINGLANVVIHEAAVGETAGQVDYMDFDVSSGVLPPNEDHPTFPVDLGRIEDQVCGSGFAAAKLDVEGAELAALTGAASLLERADPPVWIIELIDSQLVKLGATAEAVVDLLAEHGFSPAWFDARTATLDFDPAIWRHHDNVIFVSDPHRQAVTERVAQFTSGAARAR